MDSRRPKKKKRVPLGLGPGAGGGGGQVVGGALTGGGSSGSSSISQGNTGVPTKKKRPKLPAPSIPSIFDNLN